MERLDDLEIRGYKIYQDREKFCFGIDAVLLANFSLKSIGYKNQSPMYIADLCSGTLPIPLIMYAKRNIDMKISAFEIDKDQVEISKKSIWENKNIDESIVDDIELFNIDIKNIVDEKYKYLDLYNKFDMITCNPPYIKDIGGEKNEKENMSYSKHEVYITFDDICKVASLLLKSNKKFCIVHRTNRLSEIISTLKKYKLEPKTVQFVHPYKNKISNLVLIEAVKCGREETKVLEPIIVFNENSEYTEEVLKIYGK